MKQSATKVFITSAGVLAAVGVVFIPLAAFAAVSDSANTVINADIGSTISISTSGTVNLAITPTPSGSATSASDTVSVSTNNELGYHLQLASSSAQVTLTHGADSIAAASGSFASPATLGNNTWGFRVDGVGTFGSGPTTAQTNQASLSGTWAAIPASGSPVQIKNTSTTATADTTTVWYGAMADTTKPNGTYTNTVTYTATTN